MSWNARFESPNDVMQGSAPCRPGFDMVDQYDNEQSDGFSLVVSNTRSGAHFARIRFAAYLSACALDAEWSQDVILAVGEALANAAEHGHRPNGTISVNARRISESDDIEQFHIEISDDGHGFGLNQHLTAPDVSGSRGFGIYIMRSIMDSVEFHDGGRRVVLRKRLSTEQT